VTGGVSFPGEVSEEPRPGHPPVALHGIDRNEIGSHFVFPGTYAVRPSTLRAVFMDLASELGDQGFRWILARVTGATAGESIEEAKRPDWPGYLGSPRQATAALGARIWSSFAAAASEHVLKILDGADPGQFQRYADLLARNPLFQTWIKASDARDAERQARQQAWIAGRR
jgi:hypothetical protein